MLTNSSSFYRSLGLGSSSHGSGGGREDMDLSDHGNGSLGSSSHGNGGSGGGGGGGGGGFNNQAAASKIEDMLSRALGAAAGFGEDDLLRTQEFTAKKVSRRSRRRRRLICVFTSE